QPRLPHARVAALSHGLRLPRPARGERRGAGGARSLVAHLPERGRRHPPGDAAARDRAEEAPASAPPQALRRACAGAGVTIAFVGIGSNLEDPVQQVRNAFAELDRLPHTRVVRQSSLYRSAPIGYAAQPDFINAVAQIETGLAAERLLAELQAL